MIPDGTLEKRFSCTLRKAGVKNFIFTSPLVGRVRIKVTGPGPRTGLG